MSQTDNDQVQDTMASENVVEQAQPEQQVEGTPEDVSTVTESSATNEQYDEGQVSESTEGQDTKVDGEVTPDKQTTNKYAKVESENVKLKRQVEDLTSAVAQDEDTFRKVLKRSQGLDDAQVDAVVSDLKAKNPVLWTDSQAAPQQPDMNQVVQQATTQAREAAREEYEAQKAVEVFWNKFPEMNPVNMKSDEEKRAKARIAGAVGELAEEFVRDGVPLADAYSQAYEEIRKPFSKEVQQAREEGELEALAASNVDRSTTMSPPSAQKSGQTGSVNLTPEELEMAKQAGLSAEEYAAGKNL